MLKRSTLESYSQNVTMGNLKLRKKYQRHISSLSQCKFQQSSRLAGKIFTFLLSISSGDSSKLKKQKTDHLLLKNFLCKNIFTLKKASLGSCLDTHWISSSLGPVMYLGLFPCPQYKDAAQWNGNSWHSKCLKLQIHSMMSRKVFLLKLQVCIFFFLH